jgi:hypothetical protein
VSPSETDWEKFRGTRTHSGLMPGLARSHRFYRYRQYRKIRTFVAIATKNVRRERVHLESLTVM